METTCRCCAESVPWESMRLRRTSTAEVRRSYFWETVFKAYLEEQLTVPHSYAPAHLNKQRAGAVAVLGMHYYREGKTESAAEHRPEYLRLSQAERERKEQEAAKGKENV